MLKDRVDAYVAERRAMGYKYRSQSGLLQSFVAFAAQCDETHVRAQTVLDWAALAPSPMQRRNRLLTVRRFAIAIRPEDPNCEIPPPDAFGRSLPKRKIRLLFSPDNVLQLLAAASDLKPTGSIRPRTYATLFGLLSATGIRISEAIALNIEDVTDDGLLIKATKFRKDRLVPMCQSTHQAILIYRSHRSRLGSNERALFISNRGTRLAYSTVNSIFLQLMRAIGLRDAPGEAGACIHDLRHTFAVRSLEQCCGDRAAVSQHMVALSTYLGHAHISDTYWYLQATPKLLRQISEAQEECYGRDGND